MIIATLFACLAKAEEKIGLPTAKGYGKMSLEESLYRRRSIRSFQSRELTNKQLAQLLWAAQGITDSHYKFRTAPSAGAKYPLTVYVAKRDGLFKYLPNEHKLVKVSSDDKRPSLVRSSLGQSFIREAPVVFIIAANFRISQDKYGPRAFRYVFMEIGHVAQNIHLQAVTLGLGSVPVGAFWDDVVRKTLELPDELDPLYMIPIGYIK